MTNTHLHIVFFDGTFKTTTFIRRLMKSLVEQGVNVSVIGFNTDNPTPVPGVAYYSIGSNQSYRKLITTSVKWQGIKALKTIRKANRKHLQEQNLECLLKYLKPDLIHAQWYSVLPWLEPYIEKQTYRVLLSQRGYHTNVRPFVNSTYKTYLQQLYPKLQGLHSVSRAIAHKSDVLGMPKTGMHQVVYTGIPCNELPATKPYVKTKSMHIVTVGRPHWIKGYVYALQAISSLLHKYSDVKYTIVGAAHDEELTYLINSYKLQDHVILTQAKPQNALFALMQEASVFLLPSIEEGLANVVVEAMALGVPVISTDCGGMQEVVIPSKTGWLVPTRNPSAIANALYDLQQTPEKDIQNIIDQAKAFVLEQHDLTKNAQKMITFYKQLIA